MNILINCSNLKKGGGLQVADSVCRQLINYSHNFIVVLPPCMDSTAKVVGSFANCHITTYDMRHNHMLLLTGRDSFMDGLVRINSVDVVLSIFGPVLWKPKVKHVCGFARGHIVLEDSPYYSQLLWFKRLKEYAQNRILRYFFNRSSNIYFTENPLITDRLSSIFPNKTVVTITNCYNQVFDISSEQIEHPLPSFDGISLLSVNTPYPHKNLGIAIETAKLLKKNHPTLNFRFVITANSTDFDYDFNADPDGIANNFCLIGSVKVNECPSLYRQCNFTFQPTLMECFTATYCEGMRMGKPIVTTDLPFARGLCGDAAIYYDSLNAESCAAAIFNLASNKILQDELVENGKVRLSQFDNFKSRADKVISLCEQL